METVDDLVIERLNAKDHMLFGLSDILDAKAGIGLVIITFLASQSTDLLTGNTSLPLVLWLFQLGSIACLALAGIAAVGSLWPRQHGIEKAEGLDEWVEQLRVHYSQKNDPEEAVATEFRRRQIEALKDRIKTNREIDEAKSDLLTRAYRLAGLSLGLNLATLTGIVVINNLS